MAAVPRVVSSSRTLAADSPVHSSLLVLQVSCPIGGEPGLGGGGVSQSSLLCGVGPEGGPAGWKAGLGQCLCRGWAGPSSPSYASSRSPGQEAAGPVPPPSLSLLRIGLFCHVVTCICRVSGHPMVSNIIQGLVASIHICLSSPDTILWVFHMPFSRNPSPSLPALLL